MAGPSYNRTLVYNLWSHAVKQACGKTSVQRVIETNNLKKPTKILSIGKAASDMAIGALSLFRNEPDTLIVTKYGHTSPSLPQTNYMRIIESSHPIPDENSLKAGTEVLNFISSMDQNSELLFLISGGASSLVEVLEENIDLKCLTDINHQMLSYDLPIQDINKQRHKLSKVKAGALLSHFPGKKVTVIYISDVPDDDLKILGSGIGDCRPEDQLRFEYNTYIAANNYLARQAIEDYAKDLGIPVIENSECLCGEIKNLAPKLADRLITGNAGIYIWGGEPTVELPKNPGIGGRNQALALLLARDLYRVNNISVIVGGTDGTDGPTKAAGGIIDGSTYKKELGHEDYLKHADAGTALSAVGSLLVTGPTGTNVMDLIVAAKLP